MAIQVRVGAGESSIENQQIRARLDALGLKVDAKGQLDEASAANIAGGLDAVKALAKDGVLTADALATLRRQAHIVGRWLDRDVPISEKESRAWRSMTMEVKGTAATMLSVVEEMASKGLSLSMLHRVRDRFKRLNEQVKMVGLDTKFEPARMARTSPDVLREGAAAFKVLADAATIYQQALSLFREEMAKTVYDAFGGDRYVRQPNGDFVKKPAGNFLSRAVASTFSGTFQNTLAILPSFIELGKSFALPIGDAQLFAAASPPPKANAKGPDAVAQSIVSWLGADPGWSGSPGAVSADTAKQSPHPEAFRSVFEAARHDMVGTRTISNSYGNMHTSNEVPKIEELYSVARPTFRDALEKTRLTLSTVLAQGDPKSRRAVEERAAKLLGAEAHYISAVGALYEAAFGKTTGASAQLSPAGAKHASSPILPKVPGKSLEVHLEDIGSSGSRYLTSGTLAAVEHGGHRYEVGLVGKDQAWIAVDGENAAVLPFKANGKDFALPKNGIEGKHVEAGVDSGITPSVSADVCRMLEAQLKERLADGVNVHYPQGK
jgi:hypothetical protein